MVLQAEDLVTNVKFACNRSCEIVKSNRLTFVTFEGVCVGEEGEEAGEIQSPIFGQLPSL